MVELRALAARIGAIARCTLVGMLVGTLATQAVAEGAANVNQQSAAKLETENVPSGSLADQISLATTENLPLTSEDADLSALPDAPTASAGPSESASVTMPPELKAMMDDAAQNSQDLQSAPAKNLMGFSGQGC